MPKTPKAPKKNYEKPSWFALFKEWWDTPTEPPLPGWQRLFFRPRSFLKFATVMLPIQILMLIILMLATRFGAAM